MVLVDLEFLFSISTRRLTSERSELNANSWDIELKTRRETLCLRLPCTIHKLSWVQKWRLTIYPDGMHNWLLALEIKHQHFKDVSLSFFFYVACCVIIVIDVL